VKSRPVQNYAGVVARQLVCAAAITAVAITAAAITVAATPLASQPVRLAIHPRAGDTLLLRIEQQTELVSALLRPSRDSTITVRTTMIMYARAIIERSSDTATTVVAIADSVRVTSSPRPAFNGDSIARSIVGKQVRMLVLSDGSSELIKADAAVSGVLRAIVADMPAILPKDPVYFGASWERVVPIPAAEGFGAHAVRTTFRFDSLSVGGRMAYISMRGVITASVLAPAGADQTTTSGDMSGRMTLDRKLGWIVDSVASIAISATVRRPIDTGVPPMSFQMRITQQMRTLDQR
jgi:hypothetical protein